MFKIVSWGIFGGGGRGNRGRGERNRDTTGLREEGEKSWPDSDQLSTL